jgi:eukaryotic-like serine/threonine-protein kinase
MSNNSKLVQDILLNAVEIGDPQRRAEYLTSACGTDAALRQDVEELLRASTAADAFLPLKPVAAPGAAIPVPDPGWPPVDPLAEIPFTERPGDYIGRYQLIEKIGEGGCGVVYLAEQREPVRRRVALKIIKLGMDTRQVVARFEAERQALALMDHPNIAKVLDGGITRTGRSFFVMELVPGVKITRFCDQNRLSVRDRLGLFTKVCHGIQHAHQKGIIHRDLKPSNILVSLVDGVPVPQVIDFGIAKATEGRLTEKTLVTALEQFMGTPAYMSPEQAHLTSLDIDTRSDVYSLGVLLYELLTGRTPFENKELVAQGLDEMRRTIREQEPVRPSVRLARSAEADLAKAAAARATDPNGLIRLVEGDLDWIVMKCLEKERNRRFTTAHSLARDIQRHLDNEPVTARPPSTIYVLQKTVRRHRLGFIAGAGVVLVLAAGIVVSSLQAVRARRAEREQSRLLKTSRASGLKARSVAGFLRDVLSNEIPTATTNDTSKQMLRKVLLGTAQRAARDFQDQPEVEAEILVTVGDVYAKLGAVEEADTMYQTALDLQRRAWGPDDSRLADGLDAFARFSLNHQMPEAAETSANEAVRIRKKSLGERAPKVAASLMWRAEVLTVHSNLAGAEADLREAVSILKPTAVTNESMFADGIAALANFLLNQHRFADVDQVVAEAWPVNEAAAAPGADLLCTRAEIRARTGRWKEAVDDLRKWMEADSDNHKAYQFLGVLLAQLGDERAYRELCGRIRVRFGRVADDPSIADRMAKTCMILPFAADDHLTETRLADVAMQLGEGYAVQGWFRLCKGLAEYRQGNYASAVEWIKKALQEKGATPRRDAEALMVLAMAQHRLGKPQEASQAFAEGTRIGLGTISPRLAEDLGQGWVDWLIASALMREAKNLLEAEPTPVSRNE